jgi:hypothetical protein
MTDERRVLKTLAGCPRGATADNLSALGFDAATLASLVRAGLVRTRVATMANPKGLKVTWFYITDLGRDAVTNIVTLVIALA